MAFSSLLILGFLAGATIILGLPIGRVRGLNPTFRASMSMVAAGILIFLLVEILGDAQEPIAEAFSTPGSGTVGTVLGVLLAAGIVLGLVGLVAFEKVVIRKSPDDPVRLSFMIAAAIGFHNLSEGLAIGQAWASGMGGLSVLLIVGFALHNATEGFGIMAPSVHHGKVVSWGKILLLALIGGGPTFVGTLLGSLWTSSYLSVFVLGAAGGALIYVVKELFGAVRRLDRQIILMSALCLGFMLGSVTAVIADRGVESTEKVAQTATP